MKKQKNIFLKKKIIVKIDFKILYQLLKSKVLRKVMMMVQKDKTSYEMDELFKKIYDIFQSKKISINKNSKILKNYLIIYELLLSNIRKIEEI